MDVWHPTPYPFLSSLMHFILLTQLQDDMRQLIDQQSRTAQERAELQAALDKEAEERIIIEQQKTKLAAKLKVIILMIDNYCY